VHEHVFQLDQASQVDFQLRVAHCVYSRTARRPKTSVRSLELLRGAVCFNHAHRRVNSRRVCGGNSSSVRAQDFMREAVGERNVIERDFDIAQRRAPALLRIGR